MKEELLYNELISLIAPKEETENFKLVKIIEKWDMITLYFKELPNRIPKAMQGKSIVLDGYLNKLELQTFPLKD